MGHWGINFGKLLRPMPRGLLYVLEVPFHSLPLAAYSLCKCVGLCVTVVCVADHRLSAWQHNRVSTGLRRRVAVLSHRQRRAE